MDNCIFCKIIRKEIPSIKLYEDDDVYALMDIQPINPGHLLIIPKMHSQLISGIEDSVVAKMNVVAKKLNTAIRNSGLKAEGVNFFLADGEAAGQEVYHVHLHVFPRFRNDGFGIKFPESHKSKPDFSELESNAQKILSAMDI